MTRTRRARLLAAGAVLVVVAAGALAAYLTTPRTQGLEADWEARPLDGTVVGHVLLSGDHTALDLRTGRSVSLGSAAGGRAYAGDGRLVVAGPGRVDSVSLDGSGRWTWHPPAGRSAVPLAARAGSTLVATCPAGASDACDLVGLDARGRQAWRTAGSSPVPASPPQGLPHAYARPNPGGGVVVTDPVDGREGLAPGADPTALPDGPAVVPVVQGGECVLSAYDGADPTWTRVLGPCTTAAAPRVATSVRALAAAWPGGRAVLDPATGRPAPPAPTATRSRHDTPLDPLRWGSPTTVLAFRDGRDGRQVAQLAATGRLDLLLLDGDAVVVRTAAGVMRWTLAGR